MARITFSTSNELAAAAQSKAAQDSRSLSSYVTKLIERDVAGARPESNQRRAMLDLIARLENEGVDPLPELMARYEAALASKLPNAQP